MLRNIQAEDGTFTSYEEHKQGSFREQDVLEAVHLKKECKESIRLTQYNQGPPIH